jgi:hypothetical protein
VFFALGLARSVSSGVGSVGEDFFLPAMVSWSVFVYCIHLLEILGE